MNTITPVFPRRIEIELSSLCNLRCTYCPRLHLDKLSGFISQELFRKIIDEASAYPEIILVLHRRGESLLHPSFNELMLYTSGKFKEVQLATNATLLDEEKFDAIVRSLTFLSFSLDVPSVFNKTRIPAKYTDVERKILKFLEFNSGRVKTQVSMVKTEKTSLSDIETFKGIWKGKVDRIRVYEEHSIDGVFGALRNKRMERKPCVMPNYEVLIYSDGKVGRCNHDWEGREMGDVYFESIQTIWNSKKYTDLRRQHACLEISDLTCARCDSWYAEVGNQGTGEVLEDA